MPDIADIGNDYAEKLLAMRLGARVVYSGKSLKSCEACGNDIPEARQKAVQGCTLCIACAEVRDLRARR